MSKIQNEINSQHSEGGLFLTASVIDNVKNTK